MYQKNRYVDTFYWIYFENINNIKSERIYSADLTEKSCLAVTHFCDPDVDNLKKNGIQRHFETGSR